MGPQQVGSACRQGEGTEISQVPVSAQLSISFTCSCEPEVRMPGASTGFSLALPDLGIKRKLKSQERSKENLVDKMSLLMDVD